MGSHREEQRGMRGERSGHRVVSVPGSAQPCSVRRASRLLAPLPLQREPASQPHCFLESQHMGKNPLGGAVGQGFLFLVIPRNSSLSGRLGQGGLRSHCVPAKRLGDAGFPTVDLVKGPCTLLLP